MNSIDSVDLKDKIFKYGKYLIILVILILIFILTKGCNNGYGKIEKNLINSAKTYVEKNKIFVGEGSSVFISITDLDEIEGTEFCSKASGVVVSRSKGNLNYEAYLKCDDYESKLVNNKNKIITLIGDETITLNKGEVYTEQYYTLSQDADVIVSGNVGTTPGIYKVRYDAYVDNQLKETAYRTVIVSDYDVDQTITALKNKFEPVIILEGETDVYLRIGQTYKEAGYKAIDYEDGKISRKVVVDPNPSKLNNKN